ncbi:MAG: hypothetical protein O7F12_04005, partial [Nitrospirae bacterium]|nr:hypothetical protein [Nitrospirota bacterium]
MEEKKNFPATEPSSGFTHLRRGEIVKSKTPLFFSNWRMSMEQTVCLIIPPSIFLLDERVFMTLGV